MKKSQFRETVPAAKKKNLPLALVIILDLLLIGVGLVVFAMFHHVIPRDIKTSGESLPRPTTMASSTEVATMDLTSAQETVIETTAARGAFGAKFADKFSGGAIEQTANSYVSDNINLQISKVQANDVTYFVADIYVRDVDYLRTGFAGGNYARGITDKPLVMATENNAILAITGDYYGIRSTGIVIRNGELYRDIPFEDTLVMNYDGTMQTFSKAEFDINTIKANGAWQAWSFGPMLLQDGQPMTSFNSNVTGLNPRTAIGYFEPGHYCFVTVDGRQDGYSIGMSMKQMSQLFFDLGCMVAYNLDGGQSAEMIFGGQIYNQPYNGGRNVSDIVYLAE